MGRTLQTTWTSADLREAVKNSFNRTQVAKALGLTTLGANSKTINREIKRLGLDISHFDTNSEHLKKLRQQAKKTKNEEIFIKDSSIARSAIKARILRDNLIPYKCAICSMKKWKGKELSLHLDHINGINNDNTLSNLRFLCPNCHSQTSTYCGKKLKREKKKNFCIDCNIEIYQGSRRCNPCALIFNRSNTKIEWPSTTDLIEMVNLIGYRGVGKKLKVSDNAVKKRIKNYPNYIKPL